jgi:hypothetical protein
MLYYYANIAQGEGGQGEETQKENFKKVKFCNKFCPKLLLLVTCKVTLVTSCLTMQLAKTRQYNY